MNHSFYVFHGLHRISLLSDFRFEIVDFRLPHPSLPKGGGGGREIENHKLQIKNYLMQKNHPPDLHKPLCAQPIEIDPTAHLQPRFISTIPLH